jgi:hypothetical protein
MLKNARAYLALLIKQKITLFLMIYFLLSVVCFVLDLIAFFIGVSFTQNEASTFTEHAFLAGSGTVVETIQDFAMTPYAYGAPIVLIMESLFITLSLWYIIWAASYAIKLPSSFSGLVV